MTEQTKDIPTADGAVESVQANCAPKALQIKLKDKSNFVTRGDVSAGAMAAMTAVVTTALAMKKVVRVGYEASKDEKDTYLLNWVQLVA